MSLPPPYHVKLAAGLGRLISQALRGTARGAARSAGNLARLPLKYPKTTAGVLGTAPLWKPLWDKTTSNAVSSHLNERWRLDKPQHASPVYRVAPGIAHEAQTPLEAYRHYADAWDALPHLALPENYLRTPLYASYSRGADPWQSSTVNFPEPHHQRYLQQRYLKLLSNNLATGDTRQLPLAEQFAANNSHPAVPDITRLTALYRLWQATGHPHYLMMLRAAAAKSQSPDPAP